ncbi:oligopeptide transport ATP-binding protein OppD [Veillonellaceae bacterium DNF00626]|nr:oligopeptide transport ATP-binding protein OppD [Veillonellaceae bacterium DNF00626]
MILDIRGLSLSFFTHDGEVEAVRDVSLSLHKGEIVALVGESGCGKSTLCRSIVKLIPSYARIKKGQILIHDRDITDLSEKEMRHIRGTEVGMVFQNPLTTLNPVMTVGSQLREALMRLPEMTKEKVEEESIRLLELVGIPDGKERLSMTPGEFSGGQRQRVTLAIALASKPELLLADEPTTALDVTVQLRLLDLFKRLAKEQGLAILLVTHDLGVAACLADRVGIMYAGRMVEIGDTDEIFYDPRHPYTWGLLGALPSAERSDRRLIAIEGMPPDMAHLPKGDAFADRNAYALAIDYEKEPPMFSVSPTHMVATWLLDPRAPKVELPAFIKRRQS